MECNIVVIKIKEKKLYLEDKEGNVEIHNIKCLSSDVPIEPCPELILIDTDPNGIIVKRDER